MTVISMSEKSETQYFYALVRATDENTFVEYKSFLASIPILANPELYSMVHNMQIACPSGSQVNVEGFMYFPFYIRHFPVASLLPEGVLHYVKYQLPIPFSVYPSPNRDGYHSGLLDAIFMADIYLSMVHEGATNA
jgi:hypothetical protein